MRAWLGIATVLALAAASSVWNDDPPWKPARVDGFYVLEGDIHAHTVLAGALPTPIDLVLLARRQQLDFVAVVEHNSLVGAELTEAFARWFYPEVIVIPSEEITTRSYHLLAVGLSRAIDASRPLAEVADEVHRQGGAVVAAHPVERFWAFFLPLARAGRIDGVETMHPIRVVRRRHATWRGEDLVAFWKRVSRIAGRTLAALGGSDYHGLSALGLCRSIVLARERSAAGIVEAIRAGRTVAADPSGRIEGDPKWVSLLARAGYRVRPSRHSYAEASPAGQALGWVILAVLVASLLWRRTVPGA